MGRCYYDILMEVQALGLKGEKKGNVVVGKVEVGEVGPVVPMAKRGLCFIGACG